MSNDMGYAALTPVAYKDPVTVGWGQQVLDNITAVANLLMDYQKGCRLSYVSTGTIEVGTGCLMINGHPRRNTTTSTVTFGLSGGAGYTEASSTSYYVWAFASGSTSIFQIGLNQTASNHTGQANARLLGKLYNGTGCAIEQLYDYQYGVVFGNWVNKTTDYGAQQAATDGFFLGIITCTNVADQGDIALYTDSAADPATIRGVAGGFNQAFMSGNYGGYRQSACISVKKGDYFKAVLNTAGGAPTVAFYWIPAGGSIM